MQGKGLTLLCLQILPMLLKQLPIVCQHLFLRTNFQCQLRSKCQFHCWEVHPVSKCTRRTLSQTRKNRCFFNSEKNWILLRKISFCYLRLAFIRITLRLWKYKNIFIRSCLRTQTSQLALAEHLEEKQKKKQVSCVERKRAFLLFCCRIIFFCVKIYELFSFKRFPLSFAFVWVFLAPLGPLIQWKIFICALHILTNSISD